MSSSAFCWRCCSQCWSVWRWWEGRVSWTDPGQVPPSSAQATEARRPWGCCWLRMQETFSPERIQREEPHKKPTNWNGLISCSNFSRGLALLSRCAVFTVMPAVHWGPCDGEELLPLSLTWGRQSCGQSLSWSFGCWWWWRTGMEETDWPERSSVKKIKHPVQNNRLSWRLILGLWTHAIPAGSTSPTLIWGQVCPPWPHAASCPYSCWIPSAPSALCPSPQTSQFWCFWLSGSLWSV